MLVESCESCKYSKVKAVGHCECKIFGGIAPGKKIKSVMVTEICIFFDERKKSGR